MVQQELPWVGCGHCAENFPCHNGENRCIKNYNSTFYKEVKSIMDDGWNCSFNDVSDHVEFAKEVLLRFAK